MIFKCSQCGKEYTNKIKFCEECGGNVDGENSNEDIQKNICVNCGGLLGDNIRFCPHCGKPIIVDNGNEYKVKNIDQIPEDETKSLKWYEAANEGYADAQFQIGRCYATGEGVPKNKNKAFEWYMKAAEQGMPEAQLYVGSCLYWGRGIAENKWKAFEWYMKAAEQGYSDAQCSVASCYCWGHGVTENKRKAFEWYMKAADQGHKQALFEVSCFYSLGDVFEQNVFKAIFYKVKSESVGNYSKVAHLGEYRGIFIDAYIDMKMGQTLGVNCVMNFDNKKVIEKKIKNAISAYAKDFNKANLFVLYDKTFFGTFLGSGKEGFIITDDFIMITSTEPQIQYDIKGKCDDLFNSASFKKLSDKMKEFIRILKQKYDEYFTI